MNATAYRQAVEAVELVRAFSASGGRIRRLTTSQLRSLGGEPPMRERLRTYALAVHAIFDAEDVVGLAMEGFRGDHGSCS